MAFHRGYPVRSLNAIYRDLKVADEREAGAEGGVAPSRRVAREARRKGEGDVTERVVAGNRKQGRLIYLGSGTYEGERPSKGGRFETQRFKGGRSAAYLEWMNWWAQGSDPEVLGARFRLKGEEYRQAKNEVRVARIRERAAESKTGAENGKDREKEEPMAQQRERAATSQAGAKEKQDAPARVYVLSYRNGRTSKLVAAYLTDGEALEMAEALGVALEVSGAEGEYTVDELPVRS